MQNMMYSGLNQSVFTSQQLQSQRNKNKKQNKHHNHTNHYSNRYNNYNSYNNINRTPFLSEEESEGENKSYQQQQFYKNQSKFSSDYDLNFIHIVCDNEIVYSDPQIDPEKLSSSPDEESKSSYAMGSVYQTVDTREIGLPSFI